MPDIISTATPSPNPPPARRKWDQKYNQTEKAREAARRYYYSEKGQRAKLAYRAAYKPTPEQRARYREAGRLHEREGKYKARRKRYDQTAKGQAAKAARDKRFAKTEKGRFSKRKTEIKRKHQIETSSCTLTREQWQEIKAAHGHACAYCKRLMQRLEMDHVIPLSKGGSHTKDNIVPACRKCNAKKGNRSLSEFVSAGKEQTAGRTKTVIHRTRQLARCARLRDGKPALDLTALFTRTAAKKK